MIIPYTDSGKLLVVCDQETQEWGFISGGVKKHEHPFDAANRELQEETSSVLHSIPTFHRRIEFRTTYRPPQLLKNDKHVVTSTYYVYTYRIDDMDVSSFVPNKEISSIRFDYFDEINPRWVICDYIFNRIL